MVLAIDTLTVARKLEGAGFERRQAEACVEAMRDTVVTGFSDLATRSDLERFATKEDLARALERFATKEELERFATKEDLGRFATKEDLARAIERFATKEELAHFEKRMVWLWAVSTVSLAGLIVAMPFAAG